MTGSAASVTTKHFPRKGEKFINGEWVFVAQTVSGGTPTETRTDAPASISHHETIHPRKGMTPYERRNWLNTRAGWPVRGTK